VHFDFTGVSGPTRYWWLVISSHEADVCDLDPGFPVTATVHSSLRRMTQIWHGDATWSRALRDGTLRVDGPAATRRALPTGLTLSSFATVPRPA
jgi:hypothetical protein